MRRPTPVLLVVVLAGSALAIAACGSSTKGGSASHRPQLLAYVDCMRSHGVPTFPDPGPEGSIQLTPSSGINTSAPSFKTAEATCAKQLPGGGPTRSAPGSKQAEAAMLAVSRCMRAHGISAFPDPVVGAPPANPQDYAIAIGRGDTSLLVPTTIDVTSPAFRQAQLACRFGALLRGGQKTPAP